MYNEILNSLELYGFKPGDYVLSLQGPTVIFTTSGSNKLKTQPEVKDLLKNIGAEIMGE